MFEIEERTEQAIFEYYNKLLAAEGMPEEISFQSEYTKVYIDDRGNEISELELISDPNDLEDLVIKKLNLKRKWILSRRKLKIVGLKQSPTKVEPEPEIIFGW